MTTWNTTDRVAGGQPAVVVGVDGSPGSFAALDFALREAARRGALLRVVVAVEPSELWASAYGPVQPSPRELLDRAVVAGRGWTRDAAARLRDESGVEVDIELRAAPGPSADALFSAARDADLLVVGHRGRGAVASVLLGSVGLRCVVDAPCPVTVVRSAPVTVPVVAPMTGTVVPAPAGG